ncbi:Uncharacterized protein TCAP_00695 [Tolypocladium capitatum]|uniref:Uncharacterized protein n=1 Tax=Tolypocladium capitatum TaxID=45235 RepID=A0A2K3QPD2_9HYPO|nr:Uncharacterized protein TCAP_00695 [Tolypocladium capitatum]
MLFAALVVWSPQVSLAAPPSQVEVAITLHADLSTSEHTISVVEKATSKVLASSCSNTLKGGSFAGNAIEVTFDDEANGNITIGSTTYKIHGDAEFSGGIVCNRIYNKKEVFITCDATMPGEVALEHKLNERASDCLKIAKRNNNGPNLADIAQGHADFNTSPMLARDVNITAIEKPKPLPRQMAACMGWGTEWGLIGDGNPHQNSFSKQLSSKMQCGNADSCTVGQSNSLSYTIGYSVTFNFGAFYSGGFSVSETWTTGNNYGCGGHAGETLCLWYNTGFTAYTAQRYTVNTWCNIRHFEGKGIFFSPNDGNKNGIDYYCVLGKDYCREQGAGYWIKEGRAGGP